MNTPRIELDDRLRAQLVALADRRGLSPEAFVEALVREEVGQDAPDRPSLDEALVHVLDKNAELYRRLA